MKNAIAAFLRRLLPRAPAVPTNHEKPHDSREDIRLLKGVVFDLMVEIEALRSTILKSPLGASGSSPSPYAVEYRNAAFRTHHGGGCTPPDEKHLLKFYSRKFISDHPLGRRMARDEWRELIFMERLGFTPAELAEYQQRAEEAHRFT